MLRNSLKAAMLLALALPWLAASERRFGFFIGDVVERCIPLEIAQAKVTTPMPVSLGRFLVVRGARVRGKSLCLSYQVDSVPVTTEAVEVPAWSVRLLTQVGEKTVEVPAWRLVLSPLRPLLGLSESEFLQPEQLPEAEPVPVWWHWAGLVLVLMGGVGSLWHAMATRRWPFCQCFWQLARSAGKDLDQDLLVLQSAFDSYLEGCSFGRMAEFLRVYPMFAGLAEDLKRFDQALRQRFFLQSHQTLAVADLKRLARRLAVREILRGGLA